MEAILKCSQTVSSSIIVPCLYPKSRQTTWHPTLKWRWIVQMSHSALHPFTPFSLRLRFFVCCRLEPVFRTVNMEACSQNRLPKMCICSLNRHVRFFAGRVGAGNNLVEQLWPFEIFAWIESRHVSFLTTNDNRLFRHKRFMVVPPRRLSGT